MPTQTPLNHAFWNELLSRTNVVTAAAREYLSQLEAYKIDLVRRGFGHSGMMDETLEYIALVTQDIENLNTIYYLVLNATSNAELYELEAIILTYERAYLL